MSDFIYTYSGKKFYPLEPKNEDIDINDIAHALSLMTRANGHCKYFYSVAQHSINCYKEAVARKYPKEVQFGCLLHDASEAYISDITRPVKQYLSRYMEIEKKIQDTIYSKYITYYRLTHVERELIRLVDDCVLEFEFVELMGIDKGNKKYEHFSEFDFRQRYFEDVKQEFLDIFDSLKCN